MGSLVIDDITISYVGGGSPPGMVDGSVSFWVASDGARHQVRTEVSGPGINASSSIAKTMFEFAATVNGTRFPGVLSRAEAGGDDTITDTISGLADQIAGGAFQAGFGTTITTDPVNLPIDSVFEIRLDFTSDSIAGGGTSFGTPFAWARLDLKDLGWFDGMRVFNLPTGYVANSASGLIVDNYFGGAAVPLPTGVLLLLSGLGGLALLRSSRDNQARS